MWQRQRSKQVLHMQASRCICRWNQSCCSTKSAPAWLMWQQQRSTAVPDHPIASMVLATKDQHVQGLTGPEIGPTLCPRYGETLESANFRSMCTAMPLAIKLCVLCALDSVPKVTTAERHNTKGVVMGSLMQHCAKQAATSRCKQSCRALRLLSKHLISSRNQSQQHHSSCSRCGCLYRNPLQPLTRSADNSAVDVRKQACTSRVQQGLQTADHHNTVPEKTI
jgi:hypothetical protein